MNFSNSTFFRYIAAYFLFLLMFFFGCKETAKDPLSATNEPQGRIVFNTPTEIISFEEISKFNRNTKMKLRLSRNNLEVIEYDIFFDAVYDFFGERLIFCKCPDDILIGYGDSGSPVLTEDGRVAGALCYGFWGSCTQFAARSIEDLLSIETINSTNTITHNAELVGSGMDFRSIKPVSFIAGFDEEFIKRYAHTDKFNFFSRHDFSVNNISLNHGLNKFSAETANDVIPGMSIAIMEIFGDLIAGGITGTASYQDENKIFAFGHGAFSSYWWPVPLNAPVHTAQVITFIESEFESQKITIPTPDVIGALAIDKFSGIMVDADMLPRTFPVFASTKLNYKDTVTTNHSIATSSLLEYEYYLACMSAAYSVFDVIKHESPDDLDSTYAEGKVKISLENTCIEKSFKLQSSQWIDDEIFNFMYNLLNDEKEHIVKFEMNTHVFTDSLPLIHNRRIVN